MPSSTPRFVHRAVRFSVPVTFPVLTQRAKHPRLRDDVGIVPYAGGGMFWICRDDRDCGVSQAPGRIRPYETESVPPRVGVDALIDPGAVCRAVRFSGPVTFSVLTGRAGHPRLRDDVGIVPYAGGGVGRFRARLKTQGITGPGHAAAPITRYRYPLAYGSMPSSTRGAIYRAVRFFRTGDISRFDRAGRTSQIAGRCRHRPLRRRRDVLDLPGRSRSRGIAGSGHEATPIKQNRYPLA